MRSLVTTLAVLGVLQVATAALAQSSGGTGGLRAFTAGPLEPLPESAVLEHDTECNHEPLFGGVLVPLGHHVAHVEITFDPETSIFTGYILDADALEPVRIKQPYFILGISVDFLDQDRAAMLVAKEDEATGERSGDTSVFWGGNLKLAGATEFGGMIDQIAIDGTTYREVVFSYPH